ncbi:MAG: hypothetical protein ACO29V_10470 [Limnohabitans sp.]
MSKLPFVVAPRQSDTRRIGDEVCGVLELPVLGGLTVGESAVISELLATEQSSFVTGARIADAIAKEEKITLSEAFHIIESAVSGRELEDKAADIRTKHAARIEEVARVYTTAGQRNMEATVTALLRCRLGLSDWSLDDTRTMHRRLFNGVWDLAQEEQEAEDMQSTPPTEDELKKPQPAPTNAAKPTGKKSSTT